MRTSSSFPWQSGNSDAFQKTAKRLLGVAVTGEVCNMDTCKDAEVHHNGSMSTTHAVCGQNVTTSWIGQSVTLPKK